MPPHLLARAEAQLASEGRNGGIMGHYYERLFRVILGCHDWGGLAGGEDDTPPLREGRRGPSSRLPEKSGRGHSGEEGEERVRGSSVFQKRRDDSGSVS